MLKRSVLFSLVVIFAAGLLVGCASWGDSVDAPSWAMNPPREENVIYAVGEAESQNRRTASRRAKTRATSNLAEVLSSDIETRLEDQLGVIGEGEQEEEPAQAFEEHIKQTVQQQLRGVQMDRQASKKDEETGVYRGFVLMRMRFDDYEDFLNRQVQELTELDD